MAVCPFWTKTAFFDRAIKSDETPIVKKYAAMYDPDDIVARTWRDAKRGKDVCKYGFVARVQAGLTKLLPQRGHGCMDEAAGAALTQKTTFGINRRPFFMPA